MASLLILCIVAIHDCHTSTLNWIFIKSDFTQLLKHLKHLKHYPLMRTFCPNMYKRKNAHTLTTAHELSLIVKQIQSQSLLPERLNIKMASMCMHAELF